jgi:FtsZ-binding cell division protein ZapB
MGIMKQQYDDKLTSQQKRYEELTDKFNSVNNEYEDLTDKYGELKGENQRLQEKQDNKGIELGIAVLCGVGGGLLLHPKALEWIKNFLAPRLAPYGININDLASLIKYGMNSYKPTPAAHD